MTDKAACPVLNRRTEGDARTETHALSCRDHGCLMSCRCWCHGITKHLNGAARPDATGRDNTEVPT